MSIIFPNEWIEKQWRGALAKRLRQAPLEELLISLRLPLAAPGAAQLTDNLCRATVCLVETAIGSADDPFVFSRLREAALGPLVCAVSEGLAGAVGESAAWRIAAMVGIAELLAPRYGFTVASQRAVATAYAYSAHPSETIRAAAAQVLRTQQPRELIRLILRELPAIAVPAARAASDTG